MRFMDSRALKAAEIIGSLDEAVAEAVSEMEQHLREQCEQAQQTVARWSVNVEYRSAHDQNDEYHLVTAPMAHTVHVTVLLVTVPSRKAAR